MRHGPICFGTPLAAFVIVLAALAAGDVGGDIHRKRAQFVGDNRPNGPDILQLLRV